MVGEETNGDLGARTVEIRQVRTAISPGRKTYSIGGHVGGIYRPCVRDSASQFSPLQPSAANPFFKGPTDNFSSALPVDIGWIERSRNGHERVPRVSNGDVDWESQTDVAHRHANVVGDFVNRQSNDVALCVESVVNLRMLINCVHNAVLRDEEIFIVSCSPPVFDQGQQVINVNSSRGSPSQYRK